MLGHSVDWIRSMGLIHRMVLAQLGPNPATWKWPGLNKSSHRGPVSNEAVWEWPNADRAQSLWWGSLARADPLMLGLAVRVVSVLIATDSLLPISRPVGSPTGQIT